MPVGACQRAFAAAAEADGIILYSPRLPYINQRGHYGLPPTAAGIFPLLDSIFAALGGDPIAQSSKKLTPLPGDFIEESTGTLIETDEYQHFTSYRSLSLSLYPPDAPLGFDRAEYLELCEELSEKADRYRAAKSASGFGEKGRRRQRAYHDALRDLVAPACGHPPVVRVAVIDHDGAGAYRRQRDRVRHMIDTVRRTRAATGAGEGDLARRKNASRSTGLTEQQIERALAYDGYARLAATPAALRELLRPARTEYRQSGQVPAWCGVDLLRGWAFYLIREDRMSGGYGSNDDEVSAVLKALT